MKKSNLWRGLTGASLSVLVLAALGYGIADKFRTQVDNAFGTSSYLVNSSDSKYVSDYKTGEELMTAAKALAVREGREGTVIMKNDNNAFPIGSKVALFGAASYMPYYGPNKAGNSDAVDLVAALTNAGITLDPTVKSIYDNALSVYTETTVERWGMTFTTKSYPYATNESTGDYDANGYQIKEMPVEKFTDAEVGKAASDWQNTVKANNNDVAIVTLMRPGGEGATYRPGVARDFNGNTLDQNPLALSPEELDVIAAAKATCDKVVVLLNTSCTIELGPLVEKGGAHEVDGIAYIGLPNDYQFTGIVEVLTGSANASGALADTYAFDTANNPAMMNFGGGYLKDYEDVATTAGEDPRWPTTDVGNGATGSFGGSSYNGGWYIVEAESIYTGYMYYETRYYDAVLGQGNALDTVGATNSTDTKWTYDNEVAFPFGHGESYLDYTQTLKSVSVDKSVTGNVVAEISITNNGTKEGDFLGQLYVHTPYTDYDKTNLVEKSAINFLASERIHLAAGATGTVTVSVPTKYIASYDYKNAKTYILDGGDYYFTTANGSHEAVNNVLAAQGYTTELKSYNGYEVAGDSAKVYKWSNGTESNTDTTTFAKSASGAEITNKVDDADINYYLKDEKEITYLTRNNWKGTYPLNYNLDENALSLSDSDKKDEWIKILRNQVYTMKTDETVTNYDGKDNGLTFASVNENGDALTDINNSFWNNLVDEITAEEAVGAVIHGGSASDKLTNVENPVVAQNDGPTGFNGKKLSTNNGEVAADDPYYVDPETDAGKFVAAINSQTLLGSAFSEKLAYDWGAILGNTGLWIKNYEIWGAALNYHRTAYNGRNTEYPSEDPMLSNILGRGIIEASLKYGIIVGPKHIGFNDQEHNRAGIQVYMTEQKVRETDIRGFQMGIEDAGALGMMVAFNRLGATNVSCNQGLLVGIFRNEWNFLGLISTDMVNNMMYFDPVSSVMATVTMMADFAQNDASVSQGDGGVDKSWAFVSPTTIKQDNTLVEQARQDLKYQLFAFANSALVNVSTTRVIPAWEGSIIALIIVFGVLSAAGVVMIALNGLKGE
ncbi:MAG: glycoside hydrolase family 3 C-terminal domain-containing protein [Bacilli bacterium]|nr:glycoside hydrolase family 3 C-terminal domain-containing protein [Bacilli bacterium]